MPLSESQRKANEKWRKANYERLCIDIRKGTRETWKQAAQARGLSLAGLIVAAVEKYLSEK